MCIVDGQSSASDHIMKEDTCFGCTYKYLQYLSHAHTPSKEQALSTQGTES